MSDSGPANKARRNMLAAALAAGATAPTMAGIISTNSSEPNMAASLLSQPKQLFQEANRNPMVGGQFFTYAAGTLTPKTTYQDAALTIANTNPTIVNARGELLMYGAGTYRVILKDAAGNTIYDVDNIESSQSIVDSLRGDLAAATGTTLVGYASPSSSIPAKRTTREKLSERISLLDYNGADRYGNNDNGDLIQRAVNEAVEHGIYGVDTPGVFRTDRAIVLSGGVIFDGRVTPGYYAGMPYYAYPVNAKDGPKGRIIAGTAITGGMIQFDDALYSAHGFGIRNIIIDANKMAENGISMNPAVLTERVCRLTDVLVQGTVKDGIRMQNVLVQMWRNVTIASCHGFGLNFASGVSDSQIENLYVHACDGGGVQIGDGCTNIHFRGGKIEDNYANGMQFSTLTPGNSLIYLTDFSVNTNNGDGLSNNGANIFADGCTFYGHDKSAGSAAIYNAAGNIIVRGGSIFGNTCNFHQNGGVIDVQGTELNPGKSRNVVQVAGSLSVQGDTIGGVPSMRNPGARRRTIGIGGSSSASVTFANALDGGLGGAYFDMKSFDLSVTYAQYPQAPDPSHSFIGQVIVGKAGAGNGATIRVVAASNAAFIASVTAAIVGNDIVITINTGASWGNGSGHTTAYVSLVDIGHNVYG
ncbi:right-handed parallel beta-helix repeat-containing protein [Janthinobacterium aquaticum]|uniref:right-handed parallel beta-helix repeat-containing protein n=1 Tax=Janthinobacterium sp. FT58W TaxID=2654254 RepID=UPI00186B2C05|nr:right-handed parallel beta-helix repeat-containing protein [Janthinobacterium sp. FT58W]